VTVIICENCGSVYRAEGRACPDCGAVVNSREEIRRLPHEVVLQFLEHAEEFLTSSSLRQLALAFDRGIVHHKELAQSRRS
jgi:uncharacterized OB-fold protein